MSFNLMKPQEFMRLAEKIRQAFIDFCNETGFDLTAVSKKMGKSHITVQKWLPKTKAEAGDPIKNSVRFNSLLQELRKVLNAGGYELINEEGKPADLRSPELPYYDEEQKKLRYKKIDPLQQNSSGGLFSYFGIEEDLSIKNYTKKYLVLHVSNKENEITRQILYVHNDGGTVTLSKGKNKESLEGTIFLQDDEVYVVHIKNKKGEFYWQIIFRHSHQEKEFLWGAFSKVSSFNHEPTHGSMIVIAAGLEKKTDFLLLKDLSEYLLHDSRKRIRFGKVKVEEIKDPQFAPDDEIKFFRSLKPYIGTYEGYFVNPHRGRFENCQIAIYPTGKVRIWIKANADDAEYIGFATRVPGKELVFIKYDYKPELQQYRSIIVLDTSNDDHLEYNELKREHTLYGILGGIERNMGDPVMTHIAVRKRKTRPFDREAFEINLKVINLKKKQGYKELEEWLKNEALYEFFMGTEKAEFSSMGFLERLRREWG